LSAFAHAHAVNGGSNEEEDQLVLLVVRKDGIER